MKTFIQVNIRLFYLFETFFALFFTLGKTKILKTQSILLTPIKIKSILYFINNEGETSLW